MKRLLSILTICFTFSLGIQAQQYQDPYFNWRYGCANAMATYDSLGHLGCAGAGSTLNTGSLNVNGNINAYSPGTLGSLLSGGIINNPTVSGLTISYLSDSTLVHGVGSQIYSGGNIFFPSASTAGSFFAGSSTNDSVNNNLVIGSGGTSVGSNGQFVALRLHVDTANFTISDPYSQNQPWLRVNIPTGAVGIGDFMNISNGTSLVISDPSGYLAARTTSAFRVTDTALTAPTTYFNVSVATGLTNALNLQLTTLDSAQIYALPSPATGVEYSCSDCTGNAPNYLTGGPVIRLASGVWRRTY
jgi:hypothetical protein